MKMKVHKKGELDAHGTSLKGYIYTTYQGLVDSLGEPTYDTPSSDNKVQKEWQIKYKGDIFTIYDWKTYDVEYTVNQLDKWNIGGKAYSGDFIDALEKRLKN